MAVFVIALFVVFAMLFFAGISAIWKIGADELRDDDDWTQDWTFDE